MHIQKFTLIRDEIGDFIFQRVEYISEQNLRSARHDVRTARLHIHVRVQAL